MKIFLDTEFTGRHKNTTIISIGLISEDDKQFYAEFTDFNLAQCDTWTKDNVLRYLSIKAEENPDVVLDVIPNIHVGNKHDIALTLKGWLEQFDSIEFVSDADHYNFVLLIDLFENASQLPSNICPSCYDINQDIARKFNVSQLDALNMSRENIVLSTYGVIEGTKHNALHDAKLIRATYRVVNDIEVVTDPGGGIDDATAAELQGQINTLSSTVTTQIGRIDTLNSTLSTQVGQIDAIGSTITTMQGRIDDLNSTTTIQAEQINGLDTTVSTLNTTVSTLDTTVSSVNGRLSIVETQQNSLDSRVSTIEAQLVDKQYVRLTTTGSTFAPQLELASGSTATVDWEVEEGGNYTGITPTMDFGSVATRHIRLSATNNGANALNDITTFNIGFSNGEDASGRPYSTVDSLYNYANRQQVSGIENVNYMTGLIRFLAATPTLTGNLDFTNMSQLQFIECYGAAVQGVDLTGCASLRRLCMENNDLATIDLTPVAGNLYDLRGSGNRSPITFTTGGQTFTHLFHWCTQSETVVGHATGAQLPAIEEWWDWASGQTGALIIRSSAISNVQSYNNGWTSLDIANQFPVGHGGSIDVSNCMISSVDITGCQGLSTLNLSNNLLTTETIDTILATINSWGTSNHTLNLSGNASPSSITVINELISRGWTINYDTIVIADKTTLLSTINSSTTNRNSVTISTDGSDISTILQWVTQSVSDTYSAAIASAQAVYDNVSATQGEVNTTVTTLNTTTTTFNSAKAYGTSTVSSILWQDTFDRADCTGVANVGNGWTSHSLSRTSDCNIVSGSIITAWPSGYSVLSNNAGGILPADYTVSTTLPIGAKGNYFGLVGRWYNGTGIKMLFWNPTTLHIGSAGGFETDEVTLGTVHYPTNWGNETITHTIALQMVGTAITVILDGEVAVTATIDINTTQTGTSIGFCGEGNNRAWPEFTATSVTATPTVDKAALLSAISAANTNRNSVTISVDGTDVATTTQWVTQAVSDTYSTAISTAQDIYDNVSATQTDVNNTVTTLNSATTTFNNAKAYGTLVVTTTLWQDTFDRADCTGMANVGNGWFGVSTMGMNPDCNIVSGNVVTAWGDGYALLLNNAGGVLPANYTVSTTIPAGDKGHYFGLVGRWYNGNGVRLLFTNNDVTMTIGNANTYEANNVALGTVTYPTSWTNAAIAHTMAMQMVDTTITIILDGAVAATATVATNATVTGTGIGFCGEGHSRTRDYIRAEAIA